MRTYKHDSLPDGEQGRCVLLPEDAEHWVCPFDDAESGKFTCRAPRSLWKMIPNTTTRANFHGREVRHTRHFAVGGGGGVVVCGYGSLVLRLVASELS